MKRKRVVLGEGYAIIEDYEMGLARNRPDAEGFHWGLKALRGRRLLHKRIRLYAEILPPKARR